MGDELDANPRQMAAVMLSKAICAYLCAGDALAKDWIESEYFKECCDLTGLNCEELRTTIVEARKVSKPDCAVRLVPVSEPCDNESYEVSNSDRTGSPKKS